MARTKRTAEYVADVTALRDAYRELTLLVGDWTDERPTWAARESIERPAERAAIAGAALAGGEYRPRFNGYPNRETWAASLWISNDEPMYRRARSIALAAFAPPVEIPYSAPVGADVTNARRRACADGLRAMLTDRGPVSGFLADVYGYAMACVDWDELADGFADGEIVCARCGDPADAHGPARAGARPCDRPRDSEGRSCLCYAFVSFGPDAVDPVSGELFAETPVSTDARTGAAYGPAPVVAP